MRTKQLSEIASRLIDTATEITTSLGHSFKLREDFLRQIRSKMRCAQEVVHTDALGMAGRGFRESIEHRLAHYIVGDVIKGFDFHVEHDYSSYYPFTNTRFTAKAYVLTQAELTALVDEAIEIGRRS